jgi:hypothetical protein
MGPTQFLTNSVLELRRLGHSNSVRQRHPRLQRRIPRGGRLFRAPSIRRQHLPVGMLHHRRHHLLAALPPRWPVDNLHVWQPVHVLLPDRHWWPGIQLRQKCRAGHWYSSCDLHARQHDHHRPGLLPHRRGDAIGSLAVQDHRHRTIHV